MSVRSVVFGSLLAVATVTAQPADARSFSDLFVFGDSLVDAGNIFIATGGRTPNPNLGYFQGRFTNGYDYTDLLSFSQFGVATTPSLAGGNNFAFGGARVVDTGDAVPDLNAQLAQYTARIGPAGGTADPGALFVLNFGGNDVFGLNWGGTGPYSAADYADRVVSTYAGGVSYLDSIGARKILVTGIPNFGDPTAAALEGRFQTALDMLSLSPSTSLFRFSYLDFFGRVASDPASLGLPPQDLSRNCINDPAAVANGCTGIFSFDGTHPTAPIQAAIARDLDRQFGLAAVPEPTTWALMIVGFLGIGGAMRRRRGPALATA